jgi:hypothetical protein
MGSFLIPGATFAAVYFIRHGSATGSETERGDEATLYAAGAAGITLLALSIYDVGTTSDDQRRKRRKLELMPVPMGPNGTPGAGVVGRF